MRGWKSIACLLAALFLVASGIALAQGVTQNRTLIVNGQSEKVPVIQVNSRLYVDLEGLARAGNGTLSFAGGQIALTLPGAAATAGPPPAPA